MIVPMKKVTLLALKSDKESALDALRDLGVMQITLSPAFSDGTYALKEYISRAGRIGTALRQIAEDAELEIPENSTADGKKVLDDAEKALAQRNALNAAGIELQRRQDELALWGDFDSGLLNKLQQDGVNILLCQGTAEDFEKAQAAEDNDGCYRIAASGGRIAFAVISLQEIDPAKYPVIRRKADEDPRQLAAALQQNQAAKEKVDAELSKLALESAAVDAELSDAAAKLEFSQVRDSLAAHGEIVVLNGFVPAPEMVKISDAAKKFGWGFLAADPDDSDNVPVLLKDNKFTRIIKPLFDFLGIVPGYHELDVSAAILVFFTIFYAVIIGDAGYGIVFLLLALFGKIAAGKRPALKTPARLLTVLSVATIVWGALCGSWFSMQHIPGTDRAFPALECLRDFSGDSAKQANVQFFCFILAVAQLSTGRIWKALRERNWRSTGEHLGWILIIWGNFFLTLRLIVYPGDFPQYMYYFYGVGLLLVMCCGVRWNQVVDVFQFPFNIIGSFTDVLSYIRLFAVGLAGACIAGSFNNMAYDVCQISKYMLPAGIVVVLIGHVLNLCLGMLSVLVHAVRLNTLEFSNHTGISWSGQSFKAFKKTTNKSEE